MPLHNKNLIPQVGEIWTNAMVQTDGLVAHVRGTLVTFTSFTGVRAAIEFDRSYVPWVRKSVAPKTIQKCSREGCLENGFLRYEQIGLSGPAIVCPQHVVRGVTSTLIHEPTRSVSLIACERCVTCDVDGIEVLNVVPRGGQHTSLWCCSTCGVWWVHALRDIALLANSDATTVGLRAVPAGYTFKNMRQTQDQLRQVMVYDITVIPGAFTQVTGPKPFSLFEHLLNDD